MGLRRLTLYGLLLVDVITEHILRHYTMMNHSAFKYFTISTLVARYAKNKLKTSVRPKLHTANINREWNETDTIHVVPWAKYW